MAFEEINEGGLVFMRSTLIPARHAFTTRYGGVSRGEFASLNLGSNRGDDPEAVRENYRRVCALMGVMVVLVLFMHRGNIKRLLHGQERKTYFHRSKNEGG